jgi:hypothetical protein
MPMPNTTAIAAMASSISDLLRSFSVTKDPSTQSKEFRRAIEFNSRLRIFSNGAVAARQLNLSSCFGTAHFDLRRTQGDLSSVHRGWGRIS